MKWPLRKPRPTQQDEACPDLRRAQRDLDRVRSQRVEVERLVFALRVDRERNHYGETVQTVLRGETP